MPKLKRFNFSSPGPSGGGKGGDDDDPAPPTKYPRPMDGDEKSPKKRRGKGKKKKKKRSRRKPSDEMPSGLTSEQMEIQRYRMLGVYDEDVKVIDLTPEKEKEIEDIIREGTAGGAEAGEEEAGEDEAGEDEAGEDGPTPKKDLDLFHYGFKSEE